MIEHKIVRDRKKLEFFVERVKNNDHSKEHNGCNRNVMFFIFEFNSL